MSWLVRNCEEIRADRALVWYGSALALVNVVVSYFWVSTERVDIILSSGTTPVCWPMLDGCDATRLLTSDVLRWLLLGFGALSLLNAMTFAQGRYLRVAYGLLVLLTALKCLVILQDYRLIHNQHYMATWATGCYLFVPRKRATLPVLLVAFYVWAGALKLNWEWISGDALRGTRPLGVPAWLIPASCVYVLLLEFGVVWGVLSEGKFVFWPALGQLLLFHVSSYTVVGYFYPIVMFLLLSILVFARILPTAAGLHSRPRWPGLATVTVVALFSLAQIAPRLYPGNPAITGEGRFFALHMFDAPVECESTMTFGAGTTAQRVEEIKPRFVYPRIACDPLVHFALSRAYCRSHRIVEGTQDFDLLLRSRMTSQPAFEIVVDIRGFCGANVSYRLMHNSWIRAGSST